MNVNKQKNEQKLLELYAHHAFEDRKNNLECIKTRLNLKSQNGKRAQVLFRRSRICYALSYLMLFLGIGIYSSYYWIISAAHAKHHISMSFHPDFLYNLQSNKTVHIVYIILAGSLLSALLLYGSAYFFRKKAKNFKSVQQNGNTP